MYREATIHDIIYLSSHVREIPDETGTNLEKLQLGFAADNCFVVDGEEPKKPIAIGGYWKQGKYSVAWLMCTPEIEKYPLKFHRAVVFGLNKMTTPRIFAYVLSGNLRDNLYIQRLSFKQMGTIGKFKLYMRSSHG